MYMHCLHVYQAGTWITYKWLIGVCTELCASVTTRSFRQLQLAVSGYQAEPRNHIIHTHTNMYSQSWQSDLAVKSYSTRSHRLMFVFAVTALVAAWWRGCLWRNTTSAASTAPHGTTKPRDLDLIIVDHDMEYPGLACLPACLLVAVRYSTRSTYAAEERTRTSASISAAGRQTTVESGWLKDSNIDHFVTNTERLWCGRHARGGGTNCRL